MYVIGYGCGGLVGYVYEVVEYVGEGIVEGIVVGVEVGKGVYGWFFSVGGWVGVVKV